MNIPESNFDNALLPDTRPAGEPYSFRCGDRQTAVQQHADPRAGSDDRQDNRKRPVCCPHPEGGSYLEDAADHRRG